MAEVPQFERLEKFAHFAKHRANLLLVIYKSVRVTIRIGVVFLANICEHPEQTL